MKPSGIYKWSVWHHTRIFSTSLFVSIFFTNYSRISSPKVVFVWIKIMWIIYKLIIWIFKRFFCLMQWTSYILCPNTFRGHSVFCKSGTHTVLYTDSEVQENSVAALQYRYIIEPLWSCNSHAVCVWVHLPPKTRKVLNVHSLSTGHPVPSLFPHPQPLQLAPLLWLAHFPCSCLYPQGLKCHSNASVSVLAET